MRFPQSTLLGEGMADYCVYCGAAMSQSWFCEACGAAGADRWPRSSQPVMLDDSIEDELRLVTALFADVVGSTSLGEQLDPDEIKALIGECVTRMTRAVESYGGVVKAYMGDGIAAFFGLAVAREDDPIRACLAAGRILETISEYAREIEAAWGIPSVAVRVGINSGRVGTGLVGDGDPQHIALGDAINVAARLQGHSEPGSAVVGPMTAAHVASRFQLDRLGQLEIRGRRERVEAWRLGRYIGGGTATHLSGFVGRQGELARLEGVLSRLRLGRGGMVVVLGEPGIGKSRLVSEWRARAQSDFAWLSGRCTHQHVLRPYGPFVEMLCEWLEIDLDTPEVVSRVRLLARLREALGDDASAVLPFLTQLLAVGEAEEYVKVGAPVNEHRGTALRQAYASWITALSEVKPVVLSLDDVDRADASTRVLLGDLFRLANSIPLLIVMAMRDDPAAPGWEARVDALANHPRRTAELVLDPLSDHESEEFIALKDAEQTIAPAVRCSLRTRAEGNPLYLEELTRTTMEAIGRSSTGAQIDLEEDLGIPPALEGLLLARIDRVQPRARAVLQVAAVIGRRFPKWILEATISPLGLNESLDHLIREGVVQEDGLQPSRYFSFRHGLYQEAVLRTLTAERRRHLHERVAEALEASEHEPMPEEVASHYLSSGNEGKALEYLERAGRRAALLSSLSEAADLVGRARELSASKADPETHGRLTALAAELARQMGRYEEATDLWSEVLRLAPDEPTRAKVYLELARTEFELGSGELAAAACDRGLALDADLKTTCDSLLLKAAIVLGQGRLVAAKELLERVNALPGELPLRADIQRLSLWAGYHTATGDLAEAESYSGTTLARAQGCGELALELRAKRDYGIVQFVLGRLEAARTALEDVYASAMETGHVLRAQEAVANLMVVHLCLGQLKTGLELGREAARWIQTPIWRAVVLANLGAIEHEMQTGFARQRFLESMRLLEGEGDVPIAAIAALRLGVLKVEEGEVDGVEEAASHIADVFAKNGRHDVLVGAFRTLAIVALAKNRPETAVNHAAHALELMDKSDRTELPSVLRVLAQAEFQTGALAPAREHLQEALDVARAMSMRLDEAETLVALASTEQAEHRRYLGDAHEIFAQCGSERGLAQVRRALAARSS